MDFESINAGSAPRLLKKILMRLGGSCAYLTVGKEKRMLMHEPMMHEPMKKLPWPFSIGQMHDVELIVNDFDGKELRPSKRFSKEQIDHAIQEFLAGSKASDEVDINID
jgi:hypothetical protein